MFRAFENLVAPFRATAPYPSTTTLRSFISKELSAFRAWLPFMAVVGLLVALVETSLILYSGRLIDILNTVGAKDFWAHYSTEVVLTVVFLLAFRPALIALNHLFLEQTLASNLQCQTISRVHHHLLRHSPDFFQSEYAGQLASRIVQLGSALEESTFQTLESIWFALVYAAAALFVLCDIDLWLGVPLGLWLAAYFLYVKRMAHRIAAASTQWSEARSHVSGTIVDAYANIETVKLFSQGKQEEAVALSSLGRFQRDYRDFRRLLTQLSFGMNILNSLMIVGVVGPAIWLWTGGAATIGDVAATLALTIRLNGMSGWIMGVVTNIFRNTGILQDALQVISKPVAVADREWSVDLKVVRGEIEFRRVSHHYGNLSGGLDDVSIVIPSGQKVGVVGHSGAGKSSLVNLLLRFRDPEAGEILIDGQPIDLVTQDSLRRQIGMVTQDTSLLHRSIRDNILYGKPEASDTELMAAARLAEAHEFITVLKDACGREGYDAEVGERGVKLSGGQRQRIAIARVILKDAPILVLDEATSALDSEVETTVLHALYGAMEGKTVIAIAHRLSTIARMDRILVLDNGRVVEDGSHTNLLARKGIYHQLWCRQSHGFI